MLVLALVLELEAAWCRQRQNCRWWWWWQRDGGGGRSGGSGGGDLV